MSRFVLLLALISCVVGLRTILYERHGPPSKSGWSVLRQADSFDAVTFTITLPRRNLDKLESFFWQVSDPRSPMYTKYMSRKQVLDLIAPPTHVQKQVMEWIYETSLSLPKGSLIAMQNERDAIVVTGTAQFAELLFNTEMYYFHNNRNNQVVIKHLGPLSVPTEIEQHVAMITGITELHTVREKPIIQQEKSKNHKRQSGDNQCNVPYNMKNLYDIPQNLFVNNSKVNVSIYAEASGYGEGFGFQSVLYWEAANGLPKNPISCVLGDGASYYIGNDTDLEAQLDTQMVTGMAPGAKTCFYIMNTNSGWMYEFARYIFNNESSPLITSMSYGWNENEQCDNVSSGIIGLGNCTYYHIPNSQVYVNMTNTEYIKLGSIGHTLLAASGDDGTAGGHGSLDGCTTMGPIFPAASPYVTTCGATSLEVQSPGDGAMAQPPICTESQYGCECSTSTNEQVALNNDTAGFDSGGGFSFYSAMPSYQVSAVQGYIKSGVTLPASQYWNPNNRGFPDIAALGENICVLDPDTACNFVAGTSCATPIIASVATLLNNDRFNAGKQPLGFLNPLIYQMYDADRTKYFNNNFQYGNNAGECPTNMGFNAQPGYWTPLTGVGSPKFGAIRQFVASLP